MVSKKKWVNGLLCLLSYLLVLGCTEGIGTSSHQSGEISSATSLGDSKKETEAELLLSNKVTIQNFFSSHENGDIYIDEQKGEKLSLKGENLKYKDYKKYFLAKDFKLSVVMDQECLSQTQNSFEQKIRQKNQNLAQLKQRVAAFTYKLEKPTSLAELAMEADTADCVLSMENDLEVAINLSNDSLASKQWHLNTVHQDAGTDILNLTSQQNQVVIAIIDTGVDYRHEDLKDSMWVGSKGQFGYDFANNDSDPMDDHDHGTHCAGIAAATSNNSIGVGGVATKNVKIMALKALSSRGSGSSSAIANAIYYAIENGANVISMSFGGRGKSSTLERAIREAVKNNIVVFSAAGNDSDQLTSSNWYTPASYARDIDGFMAVGSTDSSDRKSSFSNYSAEWVEIGAPGSSILSTIRNNRYKSFSGTSMATPLAAGGASVLVHYQLNSGKNFTAADIERILTENSRSVSQLKDRFKNGMVLDLEKLKAGLSNGGDSSTDKPSQDTPPVEEPSQDAPPVDEPSQDPPPVDEPQQPQPEDPGVEEPAPQPERPHRRKRRWPRRPRTEQPAPEQPQQPAPPQEEEQPVPNPVPAPEQPLEPGDCGDGISAEMCEMLSLVNEERKAAGSVSLTIGAHCQALAQSHSEDMAENNFFSHTSPTNGSFKTRASNFDIGSIGGENIAMGTNLSVERAMEMWMNSSGHRTNILNSRYRTMGIGIASRGNIVYMTQCFNNE